MSLVVLSSQQNFNDGATTQDIEQSSRFQNHFTKAVEIPVNSEVAVISAKLNRNQRYTIPRKNQLKVYLGDELSDTKSLEDTTSMPILVKMFDREEENNNLTVNELKDRLQTRLNQYTLHPEFFNRTVVSASYGTGNIFEGFNIQVSASKNGSANSSAVSTIWHPFCDTSADLEVSACGTYGQVIKSTTDGLGECCAVGVDSPIATSGGEFHFELKNGSANDFAWSVGLTRPLNISGNPYGRSTSNPNKVYPKWYDPIENPIGFMGYGDIKIVKEVGETGIRVFETLHNSLEKRSRVRCVDDNEIQYWEGDALNSCFTGETAPVNSASFTSYKITVENERVSIYGYDWADTSWKLITGAFHTGSQYPWELTKALNQNEWALYPVVEINGATDDFVHITRWNGAYKPDGTNIDYYTQTYYNKMYNAMLVTGRINRWFKQLKNLDTRLNRDATYDGHFGRRHCRGTPPNNSVDKDVVYILSKSDRYLPRSLFGSMFDWTDMLGFQTAVVNETTFSTNSDHNSVRSFTSTTQPLTTSTKQAFIKLDNLNIESFNGGMGDISKILYTLPRFDNSGNAVGSLYFESPDRYYLRLNNTAPLLLNRLDCSIVGIDNRIIENLYGNTVVLLHFRSAK